MVLGNEENSRIHRSWQSRCGYMSWCVSCSLQTWSGTWRCGSPCCRKRVISKHECQQGSCAFSILWFPCCSLHESWLLCILPSASLSREIQTWCTTSLRMTSIHMSLSSLTRMSCLASSSCHLHKMVMSCLNMSFRWILTYLRSKTLRQMNCSLSFQGGRQQRRPMLPR
jgi:hypothetical protein